MKYAIMPYEDYENICNSARAKTGGSDPLKSGDISAAVDAIESGGGGDGTTADMVAEGGHAEINLPNATKIKQYAFYRDTALINITMPNVTSIGTYAFYNCSKLAITELPSGITTILADTFNGCNKIALTKLPSGITNISSRAFNGCWELALTELPSGLTSIGDSAFGYCSGLTSITFKGTPTTIVSGAFSGCTNLTTINVPWAEGAVANAPWGAKNATINYNYTGG